MKRRTMRETAHFIMADGVVACSGPTEVKRGHQSKYRWGRDRREGVPMARTAIILAALFCACPAARAQQIIWQIGAPGAGYTQFAIARDFGAYIARFPRDVRYAIGQSRPERDWPYIQPGPTDVWAGGRPHAFSIDFNLPAVPAGACRLTVRAANPHYAAPPLLQVDINGRKQYRFQLPIGGSDAALTDPAACKPAAVSLPFPSTHLKAGSNRITLTTVSGSWMLYDSVQLESGLSLPNGPVIADVQAQSTMLFRRLGGALKQAIRVAFNNVGIEGTVQARVEGGRDAAQQYAVLPGANTLFLLVNPVERAGQLRISLRSGGQEKQVELQARPERRWRLYVGPSSHTDIGYTDLQERVFDRHVQNTTRALEACGRNADFKWNLEVSFQAYLLARRDPQAFADLLNRARQGRIGVPGFYLNMLTGLCTGEEMAQMLGRAQTLARANGFKVESANLSDVPTSVGTIPMLLRQAGIRYFAEAVNEYRAPLFRHADSRLRQSPFWWESPDGSRVLAVFTEGYAQASGLGLANSTAEVARILPDWIRRFDRADYPSDAVYAYGAFSDNQPLDPRYGDVAREWNREWEYPKIIVSRVDEFFRYVEGKYGRSLPVFRGDLGSFWEDGAASSARETAIVRRAKERLSAAERWHALASIYGGNGSFPAWAVTSAWTDALFYDEHTWGAWCSTSQPDSEQTKQQWEYKSNYAYRAARKTDRVWDSSLAEAARVVRSRREVPAPAGGRRFVVLNQHSWTRDLIASASAPAGAGPWRVRDSAGTTIPIQRSGERLLFRAQSVPGLGFRAYTLESGTSAVGEGILQPGADSFSWTGKRLQLKIDQATGAIASLVDSQTGREWVDSPSGYGLNQFVYLLGGNGTRMIAADAAEPKYQTFTHTRATVKLVEDGPVRAVLLIEREGEGAPPVATYLILSNGGTLDFVNVIHKAPTLEREGAYFAFPLRMEKPEAARSYLDLPYGVIEADREQLPGACREWYSVNTFAALSDGLSTAVLATPQAPLITIGDLFRGQWRAKLEKPGGPLFGYALNNYWDTNYCASQGGYLVFAYSLRLRSGPFDPAAATRFGWDRLATMCNPASADDPLATGLTEAVPVSGSSRHEGSLLRLSAGPGVVGGITRDGDRMLVRLYNPSSASVKQALVLPGLRITSAEMTDLVGAGRGRAAISPDGSVAVPVPARSIATVALRTTPKR